MNTFYRYVLLDLKIDQLPKEDYVLQTDAKKAKPKLCVRINSFCFVSFLLTLFYFINAAKCLSAKGL